MSIKPRLLLVMPLLLVLVLGCGKKSASRSADLTGKVSYRNAPVTGGTLTFYSEAGGAISAPIQADGTFSVTQLPSGETTVTVSTENLNPARRKDPRYQKGMGPKPEGASGADAPAGTYVKIPVKYTKKETSPLKITLESGKQEKELTLSD